MSANVELEAIFGTMALIHVSTESAGCEVFALGTAFAFALGNATGSAPSCEVTSCRAGWNGAGFGIKWYNSVYVIICPSLLSTCGKHLEILEIF